MGEVSERVAHNLRVYRKNAGLSQVELAEKMHVWHSCISNWEKGTNSISIESLVEFCRIVKVPIQKMIMETAQETEQDPFLKKKKQFEKLCQLNGYKVTVEKI